MSSAYLFVAGTVVFTVYGQLVVKWQTGRAGAFPSDSGERLRYLVRFFTSPWVLSSGLAAGLAAACWVVALSHLELSRAYPFISASFVLVLVLSAIIFGEALTVAKIAGALLIIAGLILGSR
jgi:drug/metabolite transporter (DMT)-like permease